jgi:hypothetical protein
MAETHEHVPDLADLVQVPVDVVEHLIDVLEPRPQAVVAVVARVALDPRRKEGMPLAVGMPGGHERFGVAPVVRVEQIPRQPVHVRHR